MTIDSNICVQNFTYLQAETLSRFINEINPQVNYQYVMIKTLLENGLSATKDQILEKPEYYNLESSSRVQRKWCIRCFVK